MSRLALKAIQAAAGGVGEAVYVDDLFSTTLYTGVSKSSGFTDINTGVDCNTDGGMVWIKQRSGGSTNHGIWDTERTNGYYLPISTDNGGNIAQASASTPFIRTTGIRFSASGGTVNHGWFNDANEDHVVWSFKRQAKFFDVVTYSGDGDGSTAISHNLGSVPGMMIIKRTNTTGDWAVYHRAMASNPVGYKMKLNDTSARNYNTSYFPTVPTSTVFYPGSDADVNGSGQTYVAYLFAHDAQDFGTDSDEAIIKCGSYSNSGSAWSVDLGFEPQFLLRKLRDGTSAWQMTDTMRGLFADGNARLIKAEVTNAENNAAGININATGFNGDGTGDTGTWVYMAIRRPHKPAEEFAATDLFDVDGYTGTAGTLNPAIEFPFDTDMFMLKRRNATGDMNVISRLIEYPITGGNVALSALVTSSTAAEADTYTFRSSDAKDIAISQDGADNLNVSGGTYIYYGFRRAPGFFDVVAYSGDNTTNQQVSHNLGVAPELMILKPRNTVGAWAVYSAPTTEAGFLMLHNTAAYQTGTYWGTSGGTAPTATTITVDGSGNNSGTDYILYLFATVAGISKVGSYSGSGSTQTIDCGFSSGARFVLIKCTSSSANWFVWDSERGITSGLDPYIIVNQTAAETTNSPVDVNPASSGFEVFGNDSDSNRSGETYLFLAFA